MFVQKGVSQSFSNETFPPYAVSCGPIFNTYLVCNCAYTPTPLTFKIVASCLVQWITCLTFKRIFCKSPIKDV